MKTQYQYLNFKETETKTKTPVWYCCGKTDTILGIVKWYSGWRQFCFFPVGQTVFNSGCLKDIDDFLSRAKLEYNRRKFEKAISNPRKTD